MESNGEQNPLSIRAMKLLKEIYTTIANHKQEEFYYQVESGVRMRLVTIRAKFRSNGSRNLALWNICEYHRYARISSINFYFQDNIFLFHTNENVLTNVRLAYELNCIEWLGDEKEMVKNVLFLSYYIAQRKWIAARNMIMNSALRLFSSQGFNKLFNYTNVVR